LLPTSLVKSLYSKSTIADGWRFPTIVVVSQPHLTLGLEDWHCLVLRGVRTACYHILVKIFRRKKWQGLARKPCGRNEKPIVQIPAKGTNEWQGLLE
ncbi:hypothetical protein CLOP_g20997, partial [Closterium sp. NIES-67]